jgi:hypothetical protein
MVELIITFLLGVFLGWVSSSAWHRTIFSEMLSRLNKGALEQLQTDLAREVDEDHNSLPELEIRVEQHPEGLYAYAIEDNRFIAQGIDRDQLMKNLVSNLHQVRVICREDQGAHLIHP